MNTSLSTLSASLITALALSALSVPASANDTSTHSDKKNGFEISRIDVPGAGPGGMEINELSALAWDADDKLLYALSDRGNLFHFRVEVKGNEIVSIDTVRAIPLTIIPANAAKKADSRKLASKEDKAEPRADTEGLTLLNADNGIPGDSELVVVAENEQSYIHLSPAGKLLRKTPMSAPLNKASNYQSANKGLEAVAHHPEFGLLAAPEVPLEQTKENWHTIYSNKNQWIVPKRSKEARLKAMEVLGDGNLMVLERTKDPTSKLLTPTLTYVDLKNCHNKKTCQAVEKFVLPEGKQNFEGLTKYGDRQFLVVSDHKGRDGKGGTLILWSNL